MNTAKISSKYQICIPKNIRKQLDVKPGQMFIFVVNGKCIELVPQKDIKDLKGILAGAKVDNVRDRSDRS